MVQRADPFAGGQSVAPEKGGLSLRDVTGRGVGGDAHRDDGNPGTDANLAPVATTRVLDREADRCLAELVVGHTYLSSPRWRIRCAMRDCNDQSSMNPGEAVCEKSPPDWAKEARSAS